MSFTPGLASGGHTVSKLVMKRPFRSYFIENIILWHMMGNLVNTEEIDGIFDSHMRYRRQCPHYAFVRLERNVIKWYRHRRALTKWWYWPISLNKTASFKIVTLFHRRHEAMAFVGNFGHRTSAGFSLLIIFRHPRDITFHTCVSPVIALSSRHQLTRQ